MAELTLIPIGAAINELVGALGVADFLKKVCLHVDRLIRDDSCICFVPDLLQQGLDERLLSDHNLYVNPRAIPLTGSGREIFVLFLDPTGRVINHPGNTIGHYYRQGEICGHAGEGSLHGAMRANMDGFSHLIIQEGKHSVLLSGGVLFKVFLAFATDHAQIKAKDYSVIEAKGNATVFGMGHSITKLHKHSVGSFCKQAMFMANGHSRYNLSDGAKGVALCGENGSLPVSLQEGQEVPMVDEWKGRVFYTTCLRERGDALAA